MPHETTPIPPDEQHEPGEPVAGHRPTTSAFLDRYADRVGLPRGPRVPDLATLRTIAAAHTRAIPFENLDPFTGREVRIDDDALAAKLVDGGRGGYCFEQNLLLRRVLREIGFAVTGLDARVTMGLAPDAPFPGRGHAVLRVDLAEGPHLVDVGFGAMTLTGALALYREGPQETPHEPYRIVPAHDPAGLRLQARVGGPDGEWRDYLRFEDFPAAEEEYASGNHFASTHRSSPFVTGLVAARAASDRRYALAGPRLTVHHLGGPSERHELTTTREVRDVLERDLLVDTSGVPDLDDHLRRLFTP